MNSVLGPERPANISSGTPTNRKRMRMQTGHTGHDSERGPGWHWQGAGAATFMTHLAAQQAVGGAIVE